MDMSEHLPTEQRDPTADLQSRQACRGRAAWLLLPAGPWWPDALGDIRLGLDVQCWPNAGGLQHQDNSECMQEKNGPVVEGRMYGAA